MCTKLCFLLPPLSLLNHVVLVIWLFLCSVLFGCMVLILNMLFVMVKLLNHSNLLLWCPFVVWTLGDSEPPSFQCQKCQYGFNLNWSKTNLEKIFGLQSTTSAPAATAAAPYTSTASMPYQARPASYMTSTAYPHYPRPSVLPPGYPPPVGVPPPVPYHG